MDKTLYEYWLKQAPLTLTVCVIAYFFIKEGIKYLVAKDEAREKFFIGEMARKDKIIEKKDQDIQEVNAKLVSVTERFTEVTSKNNEVMASTKEVLREVLKMKL